MNAPPSIEIAVVHARKTASGVVAYSDEAMTVRVHFWEAWRSTVPDMRQRYVTINNRTFKVVWHK